ncbi:hypothetical protein [Streptomyces qinglanensis]|uniref:Uncharacterized protein n=1 Tax=Streptomyces qinglanensis TaxID=943816 RepID=A0A1H9UKJ9_9ACTN|nr:hypothetical protein [Streptomyces qinglanensis]SES09704.1 hypothetical protein SAMN05421870_108288 [Streptomyces qinglanensis]
MAHTHSSIYDVIGAPRSSPDDTGLQLASSTGGGEDPWGGEGIKSDKKSWNNASSGVSSLKESIGKARSKMHPPGKGLEADDFECGSVLGDLHTSWKEYLGKVSGRCNTLADRLTKAGSDHYKNDQARRDAFTKLNDRYKDTEGRGPKDHKGSER